MLSRPSMNTLRGARFARSPSVRPVVAFHQLQRLDRGDRPAAFGQPLGQVGALFDEPQIISVRGRVLLDAA